MRLYRDPDGLGRLDFDRGFYDRIAHATDRRRLVHDHIVPIRSGYAWPVEAGRVVRVVAVEGPQVWDLQLGHRENPRQRFCAAPPRPPPAPHLPPLARPCVSRPLLTPHPPGEHFARGVGPRRAPPRCGVPGRAAWRSTTCTPRCTKAGPRHSRCASSRFTSRRSERAPAGGLNQPLYSRLTYVRRTAPSWCRLVGPMAIAREDDPMRVVAQNDAPGDDPLRLYAMRSGRLKGMPLVDS